MACPFGQAGVAHDPGGGDAVSTHARLDDRINAVLAAAGYNFGLLLRRLAEFLHFIIYGFLNTVPARNIT